MEDSVDLARHAGLEIPDAPIPKPHLGGTFELDGSVVKGKPTWRPPFARAVAEKRNSTALPVPATEVISAFTYGRSLWGSTAKVICRLPNGSQVNYFLKVLSPREKLLYAGLTKFV